MPILCYGVAVNSLLKNENVVFVSSPVFSHTVVFGIPPVYSVVYMVYSCADVDTLMSGTV